MATYPFWDFEIKRSASAEVASFFCAVKTLKDWTTKL